MACRRCSALESCSALPGILVIALLGSAACREQPREAPSSQTPASAAPTGLPADAPPAVPSRGGPAGGPGAPANEAPIPLVPAHGEASAGITWQVPDVWRSETPTSTMRKAQYRLLPSQGDAEGGECVVFYFGAGQGGGVEANVQRWASQFKGPGGPPPAPKVTEAKVAGLAVTRVELKGTYEPSGMGMAGDGGGERPGFMLLGAIVAGPDANWFFKCTGPEKTMQANAQRFDGMIASVRPAR